MGNEHTDFWLALLDRPQETDQRVRLWNGYLGLHLSENLKGPREPSSGWPQLIVDPPDGGWPALTEEERATLEAWAEEFGGHPKFDRPYMDFADQPFVLELDLSGLILVHANFDRAIFGHNVTMSHQTRFYAQASFDDARFEGGFFSDRAQFDAPVSFASANFLQGATFIGTQFKGGASFANATFQLNVMFNDSKFEDHYFSDRFAPSSLTGFQDTKFLGGASFREVVFGNTNNGHSRRLSPARRVDFSGANFESTTDFHGASFGGAPAFFNATLHEDTDFSQIDWSTADGRDFSVEYAIRAWERLELIMSLLEKPFDRHRFFRLKMRARRRKDGALLSAVNWLFEQTADYGWGLRRAAASWLGHCFIFAMVLGTNAWANSCCVTFGEIARASIATSFANAHAFLFLTATDGYLEDSLRLLQENDGWGLVSAVGVLQAILGPIFLFLLLLTLRNRFRLG